MRRPWVLVLSAILISTGLTAVGGRAAGAVGAESLEAIGSLGDFVVGASPQALNEEGFIVGRADTPNGLGTAGFVYDPGTQAMHQLPTIGSSVQSEGALGLNDQLDIVGSSVVNGNEEAPAVAVEWRADGQNLVLGTLQNRPCVDPVGSPCDRSTAFDVNNHGVVVGGSSVNDAGAFHAIVYDPRTASMTDLGTLPGGTNSVAYGINDAGLIVGSSEVGDPVTTHAFTYDLRSGAMTDLGTLPGGTTSEARAVNRTGVVVGSSEVAGGATHPFAFDSGTGSMVDLGSLPAQTSNSARAVNDDGLVVGSSGFGLGTEQAWVYDPATPWLEPITDAGTAVGINRAGLVTGEGFVPEIIDGEVVGHPYAAYRTTVRRRPPLAPTALRVTGGCDTGPTLTWTPRRSGPYAAATGYVVYRNGVPVALTAATSFTDDHPIPLAAYTVRAGNALGLSPPSHPARWSCPVLPPP